MSRVTVKRINKAIYSMGYKIYRGNGYFYFSAFRNNAEQIEEEGVYVNTLRTYTVEEWANILKERIEHTVKYKAEPCTIKNGVLYLT